MAIEQELQTNLSPIPEKNWAAEVEQRLPGYLIANQGEVRDDEVIYSVYQGLDRHPVSVVLHKAQVAEMMSRTFSLVPIAPSKYVEWDHATAHYHSTSRAASASDLKREFRKSLKFGLAWGDDNTQAVQIGWALAHKRSGRGRVAADREHITLSTERKKMSQACLLFVVDATIPLTQRHTIASLQKYIGIWVGASHDELVEQTIYYGRPDTEATSSLDRAIDKLTPPNSADGYQKAHLLVDSSFPAHAWNRFMIHITSATDNPEDFDVYDQVTADAAKQMDYVGIVLVGHYATYSLPFRRAIAEYRLHPTNSPRLAQVPDSRQIPKAMWQLFGSWDQISAQSEQA